jgi:flagellar biosynthesis protein FlhF
MQEQANSTRVFKLVVSNAAEAVTIIQKKFGTHAIVQSVKQHQPKGVSKLWSAPKLEIIVSVPSQPTAERRFELPETEAAPATAPTGASAEALPDIEEVTKSNRPPIPEPPPAPVVSETRLTALPLEELLLQSDFDKTLVQRLKLLPQWSSLSQRSTKQGLTELIALLREEFIAAQSAPLSTYAACIGGSGVGKSTTLRKLIANRIFVHGKQVQVLKIDDDDPNPDDLLTVFCEVVGATLVRNPGDLRLDTSTEVYVDIPGVNLHQPEKIRNLRSALDDCQIRSRILVINALYDTRTITNHFEIGRHLGATHQTFTHLDELDHWAKLWRFVLKGSYPLVFQNMADASSSGSRDSFLPLLISRTFPKILLN